jgi:hypothetical protein
MNKKNAYLLFFSQENNAQIVSTYKPIFYFFFNDALALAIHEGFAL